VLENNNNFVISMAQLYCQVWIKGGYSLLLKI